MVSLFFFHFATTTHVILNSENLTHPTVHVQYTQYTDACYSLTNAYLSRVSVDLRELRKNRTVLQFIFV